MQLSPERGHEPFPELVQLPVEYMLWPPFDQQKLGRRHPQRVQAKMGSVEVDMDDDIPTGEENPTGEE